MVWGGAATRMLALVVSVLMLGGCSGESGNGRGEAPPPVSVQEYGTLLAGTIQPLDSALKALAEASAYKGLESRVTAVDKAADQAVTELTEITPPAEVAVTFTLGLVTNVMTRPRASSRRSTSQARSSRNRSGVSLPSTHHPARPHPPPGHTGQAASSMIHARGCLSL